MIFTLILSILFALFLGAIVIFPLFQSGALNTSKIAHEGFADEVELRNVISLRDALLQKLIKGNSDDERCNQLSNEAALEVLVTLCYRLSKANLPFIPEERA